MPVVGGLCGATHLVRSCRGAHSMGIACLCGLDIGAHGAVVGAMRGPGGIGNMPDARMAEAPDARAHVSALR